MTELRFQGQRFEREAIATCNALPLSPRLDLAVHDVQGYDWGHAERGAKQLALALACRVLHNDKRALAVYEDFAECVVAILPEAWDLTQSEILFAIHMLEKAKLG